MRCPIMIGLVAAIFLRAQKFGRKLAYHAAVEPHISCSPDAIEDREQQQRVFGSLAARFSFFDQKTRAVHGNSGFARSVPFEMNERVYERDLKPNVVRDAALAWTTSLQSVPAPVRIRSRRVRSGPGWR